MADGRAESTLSSRGRDALAPPPPYLGLSIAARADAYDAVDNPGGTVDFSVAENRLSLPLASEALSRAAAANPPPPSALHYGDMHGHAHLRTAVAALFRRHLTRADVRAEDLALSAGAGSVLDLVTACVCEAGDRVLVTAPGYRGLENDCGARARCTLVAAHLDAAAGFRVSVDALEKAWTASGGTESRVKLCIVSSPNNPTGEILDADTVRAVVVWSRSKGIHVVFDEIYAMSCFAAPASGGFTSVADALDGDLGDDVHIVWSFSKDFCLSGVRVGVLLSKNSALLRCFWSLTYFSSPSAQTQWALAGMLQDEEWVDTFIKENKRRLAAAYASAAAVMDDIGIPFLPAQAGFFLFIDMRRWMAGDGAAAEHALWLKLCDAKVLMTPAGQMMSNEFGWFRCCFATVSAATAEVAWSRVRKVLRRIDVGDGP
jgi:1-aminocyclopropane-1-carboxylate synthase 1/2/6